jgi:hypothetical protein
VLFMMAKLEDFAPSVHPLRPIRVLVNEALKVQQPAKTPTAAIEPVSELAARAKAAWARLIRKLYEADPLECPKCKGRCGSSH